MSDVVGHVPSFGVCKACGAASTDPPTIEPCGNQDAAHALLAGGYRAMPATPQEMARMVAAAQGAT